MSAPARFLQEVVDALPAADPVGCIVAAIHRYDTEQRALVERLIRDLAIANGKTIEQTRLAVLGALEDPPDTTWVHMVDIGKHNDPRHRP